MMNPSPAIPCHHDAAVRFLFNVTFTNNTPGHESYWDFGDGQTSSQRNVIHNYTGQGPYIIKFTSITPGGFCQVTKTDTIDFAPEIKITASPESTCGTSANVTFSYTADPASAISQRWDFDDGNTSPLAGPTHLFSSEGLYIVKLTLTYPDGCPGNRPRYGWRILTAGCQFQSQYPRYLALKRISALPTCRRTLPSSCGILVMAAWILSM